MTTSLPKIKFVPENIENSDQKHLKFKKLKLSNDNSAADIREKFKSVRTERLNSIGRYSTVEGQREQKKQKIHLNLLERKLLAGTYDEKHETGNDLNSLKQKTDLYRSQALQRQAETDKMRQLIEEIKIEIRNFEIVKEKNDEAVSKVQRKFDQQKIKTETVLLERSCLEHMITERKKVNIFLEAKINQDRAYLEKLKAALKQVFTQARSSNESNRNLMSKIERINKETLIEQRSREENMYDKQIVISKRKEGDNLRDEKSKEYRMSLDQEQEELEKKDFMDLYRGILSHIFFRKYAREIMEGLQEKYQVMENWYQKISSYKEFDKNEPNQLITRYSMLPQQRTTLQASIKSLQKKQQSLQQKNQILQQKLSSHLLTAKNPASAPGKLTPQAEQLEKQEQEELDHQRKLGTLTQDTNRARAVLDRVGRWAKAYGLELQVKIRTDEIGRSVTDVVKFLLQQKQALQAKSLSK